MKKYPKDYNPNLIIKLTDQAIAWLVIYGKPIMSKDFVGYTALIDDDIAVAVGLDNSIIPFSLNKKKPLTYKRIKKVFKHLIDTNFIKDASYDPFPEFELYSDIPFDIDMATKLNGYTMTTSFNTKDDNFVPDDDFDAGVMDSIMEKLNIEIKNDIKDS